MPRRQRPGASRPSSGGFMLPADVEVTHLEPREDAFELCEECEGRPAFFAVKRPGDAAARRLCHECFFAAVAPREPNDEARAEALEHERARLAEAERTESPEALGLMAEFMEELWRDAPAALRGDGPPPDFVTTFIARHLPSAPPPAAPDADAVATPVDLQAARLTLLGLRGALCERYAGVPVAADRFLVDPDPTPVSRAEAADRLARMPKPLACHGRVVEPSDGGEAVVAVRCRAIVEPSHVKALRDGEAYWQMEGGHYPHLARAHGAERYPALTIFCVGCDGDALLVTVAEAEQWHRDYELRPFGSGASPPSAYLATAPAAARAAHAAGAAYLMRCHIGADDRTAEEDGAVIEVRERETYDQPVVYEHVPDLGVACERCGEQPASWRATDTRDPAWPERRLCAECVAAELAPRAVAEAERLAHGVAGLSEKGRRAVAADVADAVERMERWWKQLPTPPAVAAALERCRALAEAQ